MTNTVVHKVTVTSRVAVDSVGDLSDALEALADSGTDYLYSTYVVERLEERLGDGSVAVLIRVAEKKGERSHRQPENQNGTKRG